MYKRRKKRVRTVNHTTANMFKMMQNAACWAQLNMLMNLEGCEVDDNIILILLKFVFMDQFDPELLLLLQESHLDISGDFDLTLFKKNSLDIIVEICEDQEITLSNNIIDSMIQKIIFGNFKYLETLIDKKNDLSTLRTRLFKALAIKNREQVKKSYEKYTTFRQYQI